MTLIHRNIIKIIGTTVVVFAVLMSPIIIASESKQSFANFSKDISSYVDIKTAGWLPNLSISPIAFDGRCQMIGLSANGSDIATKHTVQISKSSTFSSPMSTVLTTSGSASVSYEFEGLTGNTTYYARAKSDNGYRAVWTNTQTFKTDAALKSGDILSCM